MKKFKLCDNFEIIKNTPGLKNYFEIGGKGTIIKVDDVEEMPTYYQVDINGFTQHVEEHHIKKI